MNGVAQDGRLSILLFFLYLIFAEFLQDLSNIPCYQNELFCKLKWKSLPQKLLKGERAKHQSQLTCKYKVAAKCSLTEAVGKTNLSSLCIKVSKGAKIRNRYNQVPHLTQDTNWKVTDSQ